jgi:hypothetical protein
MFSAINVDREPFFRLVETFEIHRTQETGSKAEHISEVLFVSSEHTQLLSKDLY